MKSVLCFTIWCVLLLACFQYTPQEGVAGNIFDATYLVGGKWIQLVGGRSEFEAAPGSAAKIITRAVGKPAYDDLDGDGQADAAFFIILETGGSGTFLFAAAAIATDRHWQGTRAILIGDRVVPKTISIRDGVIIIRYFDRIPRQPLAEVPSIERTVYVKYKEGRLEKIQKRG